jgi:hypothetical protein
MRLFGAFRTASRTRLSAFALLSFLVLALAGCSSGGGGGGGSGDDGGADDDGTGDGGNGGDEAPITEAPYTETFEVVPSDVTTSVSGTVDVVASVPEDSRAMGIVAVGTDNNRKFIEHEDAFGIGGDIRGPDGAVPLSFNTINGAPAPAMINNQAAAVHFPNDGTEVTLPEGTYRFPVGAVDDSACTSQGCPLAQDTISSVVYYKTATSSRTTLKLNVVVISGVSPGITDAATAAADPEVVGAIDVIRNVYESNLATDLNVEVTVDFSAGCGFDADPEVVDSQDEFYCLMAHYPATPADNAMNIYVVTSLAFLDAGVIGLASGVPGPFNVQGLVTSGTVAEYQDDGEGTTLGYILAHEFGHYLGLFHTSQTNTSATSIIGEDPISDTPACETADLGGGAQIDNCPDRDNLMFPFVCDPQGGVDCANPELSQGQGNVVRYNPGVTLP